MYVDIDDPGDFFIFKKIQFGQILCFTQIEVIACVFKQLWKTWQPHSDFWVFEINIPPVVHGSEKWPVKELFLDHAA